jgi:hypothetical protein
MSDGKQFWLNSPKQLVFNVKQIIPNSNFNDIENLNAIMRLFIIVAIIVLILTENITNCIFIVLIGALTTYYLFQKNGLSETFNFATSSPNHAVNSLGEVCQLPTPNNPFGNMIPGDDPARPPACKSTDEDSAGGGVPVANMIEKYFKLGLYRDVNDVFDRNNSQREFVTMPATANPNARDEFTKWRFNAGSCRDGDTSYCMNINSYWIP